MRAGGDKFFLHAHVQSNAQVETTLLDRSVMHIFIRIRCSKYIRSQTGDGDENSERERHHFGKVLDSVGL